MGFSRIRTRTLTHFGLPSLSDIPPPICYASTLIGSKLLWKKRRKQSQKRIETVLNITLAVTLCHVCSPSSSSSLHTFIRNTQSKTIYFFRMDRMQKCSFVSAMHGVYARSLALSLIIFGRTTGKTAKCRTVYYLVYSRPTLFEFICRLRVLGWGYVSSWRLSTVF